MTFRHKILLIVRAIYLAIFIILLSTFTIKHSFSQYNKVDSLLKILKTIKEDTNKVNILNSLAGALMNQSPDSSILFAKKAFSIAKESGWKKGMSNSLSNIGYSYDILGNYPKALDYAFKALAIDEALNNKKGIAIRLGNIGIVYDEQNDYSKALEYYFRALKIDEELGNKNGVSRHLGNIGLVYKDQACANVHPLKRDSLLNKALKYYSQALQISQTTGDKNGMRRHLGNMGVVFKIQGRFDIALDYTFKALKIAQEMKRLDGIAYWSASIGSIYTETKKFEKAEKYLLDGLKIYKEIKVSYEIVIIEEYLTVLYEKTNRHMLALKHYKRATVLKDSLFNEEKNKELTRKELNFEFEKKEAIAKAEHKKEIEKQKAVADEKNRKQKIITVSVIGGLVLVLVFAGFIFRSLRLTRRQKLIIEEQKKSVEMKQKEIIDSIYYARRIQQALLPSKKYIEKKLRGLK